MTCFSSVSRGTYIRRWARACLPFLCGESRYLVLEGFYKDEIDEEQEGDSWSIGGNESGREGEVMVGDEILMKCSMKMRAALLSPSYQSPDLQNPLPLPRPSLASS